LAGLGEFELEKEFLALFVLVDLKRPMTREFNWPQCHDGIEDKDDTTDLVDFWPSELEQSILDPLSVEPKREGA
jgi:hypothetical protein